MFDEKVDTYLFDTMVKEKRLKYYNNYVKVMSKVS